MTVAISDQNWNDYTAYHSTEAQSDQDHPVMTYTSSSGSSSRVRDVDHHHYALELNSNPVESEVFFIQYPNPVVNDHIQFDFSLEKDDVAMIETFEMGGKIVYKRRTELKAGMQSIGISKGAFESSSNAIYLYKVTTSEFIRSGKLILHITK